jgi:hypothetical protein
VREAAAPQPRPIGVVSRYVLDMVRAHVREHGLVVWFDPDRHYVELLPELAGDTPVLQYEGSVFDLRRQADPYLQAETAPMLVIYVPAAAAAVQHGLVEATAAGIVLQPGQQPWQRNTRLSVVGRAALRPLLGDRATERLEAEIESRRMTLGELDRLGQQHDVPEILRLVYGAESLEAAALAFLAAPDRDAELVGRGAMDSLCTLLEDQFGLAASAPGLAEDLRCTFARHVLLQDLAAAVSAHGLHDALAATMCPNPMHREACVRLAQAWRRRHDLQPAYLELADMAETRLPVRLEAIPAEALSAAETFRGGERRVLLWAQERLLTDAVPMAVAELAEQRIRGFWATVDPAWAAHWSLTLAAARILAMTARVREGLRPRPDALALTAAYTEGPEAWCRLDGEQRRFLDLAAKFTAGTVAEDETRENLIARVRQRYQEACQELVAAFSAVLVDTRFRIPDLLPQRDLFATAVAPALREGKTAYMLVDGLRYELAEELKARLGTQHDVALRAAAAALPTVTEVGMVAAGPGSPAGASLEAGPAGGLAVCMDGEVLRTREDRLRWLAAHAPNGPEGQPARVHSCHLGEFLEKRPSARQKIAAAADLLVLTFTTIDEAGENLDPVAARQLIPQLLDRLVQGIHTVAALGFARVIVTADHGFLLAEPLATDTLVDPPGGETFVLRRRVWVGHGGASSPAFVRVSAADLGWQGDLEFAFPLGLAGFRAPGGGTMYLHGGISPHEVLVPVLAVTLHTPVSRGGEARWRLVPGSSRITTRFVSVQVAAEAASALPLEPTGVRVEVRQEQRVLSLMVSASYGFDERGGVATLRPTPAGARQPQSMEANTVTLMLREDPTGPTVSIHLLDAATGQELARVADIPVAIAL